MQFRTTFKKIFTRHNTWPLIGLAIILLFSFFRIWRLGFPGETVFDEVYFPKMAHQYLVHENFFDIHPPLGKLMIAAAELIFGNTTVGWRAVSLLAGLITLPVAFWSVKQIFNDKAAAFLAAFLLAIDGMFIVYSRTGLMDGFLILFGLISLGFCWQFRHRRLEKDQTAWGSLLLTGFFAGMAVAIKWIGVGFLPIVALTTLWTIWQKPQKNDFWLWLLSFGLIPAILYTVPFLANWRTDFWHQFILWHHQSWDYNVHLNATHPYASKWWSWPFLIRPIWFYYKGDNGQVIGVDAIGNPIVWWGSTLAVVYTTLTLLYVAIGRWRRTTSLIIDRQLIAPLGFTLSGWAAFYLPWVGVDRVLFLYHYFGSYLFALLLTAFWLGQAWRSAIGRQLVLIALATAVVISLRFLPIWIAYPIPQSWFNDLMWFRSWI